MTNLLLKLDKQDKDVIHCINRATHINKALFLGKVNRIGLREELFLKIGILDKIKDNEERKEYFKAQDYEVFESYFKGVHCYGIKIEDNVYICLLHDFYNEEKRNFRIDKIRKKHAEEFKILLDQYLIELAEFAKYHKMLDDAEKELVKENENGIAVYRIKDTSIFPEGFSLNPKKMIFRNILNIKTYLEDHEILKPMQEYNIGVFDVVENKKYAYVTKKLDEDYILR